MHTKHVGSSSVSGTGGSSRPERNQRGVRTADTGGFPVQKIPPMDAAPCNASTLSSFISPERPENRENSFRYRPVSARRVVSGRKTPGPKRFESGRKQVEMPTTPSLKTRLGLGAAAVIAAGAIATVGVSAASASPASPSPSATATAAPSAEAKAGAHAGMSGVGAFLHIQANSPQAAGDRAAKAATALVNHPQVFAKLPAALQADVNALKAAAPADRVKDAYKIKTTALSGGYGADIQKRAQTAEKNATGAAGLRQELRKAFSSANPGAGLQKVADQIINHPKLLAKLPANLQADLKTLKAAAPADLDTQAKKIKDTALNGGYGAQIQKAAQSLGKKSATAAPAA